MIARGESAVLAGHLERSGGGWVYRDAAQFAAAVAEVRASPTERARRGLAGRAYVAANYTWERTIGAYSAFLDRMCDLVADKDRADRD